MTRLDFAHASGKVQEPSNVSASFASINIWFGVVINLNQNQKFDPIKKQIYTKETNKTEIFIDFWKTENYVCDLLKEFISIVIK